jgi:hypothetical protein
MPQCMYIHTLGNSFPFAIWAQACLPQQLRPNTLSKEIGAVVDHPISFLSTYQVVGLVADHPTIFVRPLPSANDVRHMDQENCPPSATLMRNTTEHKVHTATCDPQPIRQKTLRTGRIPLGHCVPTHQSPPVDLQPKEAGLTTGESQGTKVYQHFKLRQWTYSPRGRTHHGSRSESVPTLTLQSPATP